jgi:hypothetical protein
MTGVAARVLVLLVLTARVCEGADNSDIPETSNAAGDGGEGRCGVIWFLHIGKTGGTTVQSQMDQEARKNEMTYVSLYDKQRLHWKWEESEEYARIRAEVFNSSRPQLLVQQHHHYLSYHGTPGMTPEFLNDHLRPLACEAYSKGCNFTLATVLRDPLSHFRSRSVYESTKHNAPHGKVFNFEADVKNCQGDDQTSFIDSNEQNANLTYATAVLRDHFSLVGKTENLDEFLEDMLEMGLGIKYLRQSRVMNTSPVDGVYASAFDPKYLDDIARCVAKDSLLYADFNKKTQKTTEPRFSCPS